VMLRDPLPKLVTYHLRKGGNLGLR
jgi:hypothetical protein